MSSTPATPSASRTNRARDCKQRYFRFVYSERGDTVQLLRPCQEPTCKTCQVWQKHLWPDNDFLLDEEPEDEERIEEHQSDEEPFLEVEDAMRALQYGLVIPRRDSSPTERRRPRFRKRIVLAFQKPNAHKVAVGKFKVTAYHIFANFIHENKIPRVTGKPGGLVKLKFVSRRDEYRSLLSHYPIQVEVRMPNRERMDQVWDRRENAEAENAVNDLDRDKVDVDMTENIGVHEIAMGAQSSENQRQLPYMTKRRRRSDEWWDDGTDDRKRMHRTF